MSTLSSVKKNHCRIALLLFLAATVMMSLGLHFIITLTMESADSPPSHPLRFSQGITRTRNQQMIPPSPPKQIMELTTSFHAETLKPMWTCSNDDDPNARQKDGGRRRKLVFIHVFKTAGTTLREVLLRYAVSCHAGIGIVSECSGVSVDSITGTNTTRRRHHWVNGFGTKQGKPCRMKVIDRNQKDNTLPNLHVDGRHLHELDILAGHLSLGVGSAWSSAAALSEKNHFKHKGNDEVQYIAFFRNAIDKFVSGVMYQKKDQHYSFHDIVDLIRKRVQGELEQHKYREGYSAYLLTPQQKQRFYGAHSSRRSSTIEERTRQILSNLEHENILVGLVERMSESLELIQYVLDSDYELTPLFESFGMITNGMENEESTTRRKSEVKKNNLSKFSTSSVIEELQKDREFSDLLTEYVKYDALIYSHALKLHTLQYQNFKLLQR
jgi:hypothetical protein